jgi:hypothetical protein
MLRVRSIYAGTHPKELLPWLISSNKWHTLALPLGMVWVTA